MLSQRKRVAAVHPDDPKAIHGISKDDILFGFLGLRNKEIFNL